MAKKMTPEVLYARKQLRMAMEMIEVALGHVEKAKPNYVMTTASIGQLYRNLLKAFQIISKELIK
jgi:hypothetical protein